MTIKPLTQPNLLSALVNFFPTTCTIQSSTESRSPSGQVTLVWANYTGHVSIPCRIAPAKVNEIKQQNQTYTIGDKIVLLRGYYQTITAKMRAVINSINYDILGIEHDGQNIQTRLTVRIAK